MYRIAVPQLFSLRRPAKTLDDLAIDGFESPPSQDRDETSYPVIAPGTRLVSAMFVLRAVPSRRRAPGQPTSAEREIHDGCFSRYLTVPSGKESEPERNLFRAMPLGLALPTPRSSG